MYLVSFQIGGQRVFDNRPGWTWGSVQNVSDTWIFKWNVGPRFRILKMYIYIYSQFTWFRHAVTMFMPVYHFEKPLVLELYWGLPSLGDPCWNSSVVFQHSSNLWQKTSDTSICQKMSVKFSQIAWMYIKYLCICWWINGPVISVICNLILPIVYNLIVRSTVQNVLY